MHDLRKKALEFHLFVLMFLSVWHLHLRLRLRSVGNQVLRREELRKPLPDCCLSCSLEKVLQELNQGQAEWPQAWQRMGLNWTRMRPTCLITMVGSGWSRGPSAWPSVNPLGAELRERRRFWGKPGQRAAEGSGGMAISQLVQTSQYLILVQTGWILVPTSQS